MILDTCVTSAHADLARDFLERHPDGWCDRIQLPDAVKWQNRTPTRSRRYGACRCGTIPIFIKSIDWTPALDATWNDLPKTFERNRRLHESPLLLAPHFHIRTEEEWIRAYPEWPSDLSYHLHSEEGKRLTVSAAFDILFRVTEALDLLESANLLHRDLKSSNILVRPSRSTRVEDPEAELSFEHEIVLADFSDDTTLGTIFWSAPELAANRPSPFSPIFSLGILAWKLLSRVSFRRMLKKFALYNAELPWPDVAEIFLMYPYLPFAAAIAPARADIWRDPNGTVLRRELLEFVFAATAYEKEDRRTALTKLFGENVGDHPARAAKAWLEQLSGGSVVTSAGRRCAFPFSPREASGDSFHTAIAAS
jgi:hypothetical protein